MTDQSKIPLPPRAEASSASKPSKASGPSLIERAASAFDFRTFQAPAMPAPMPEVPRAPAAVAPAPALAPIAASAMAPASVAITKPAPLPAPAPAPAFVGLPPVQPFRGTYHAIDRHHLRKQCLIEPDGPVNGLLEEFRIVKRQLLLAALESRAGRADPHGERIMICSAHPGDGKTFCAVNLALSMAAEKDTEVLLVDADFAKPSVLSALGLPGGPGLMDALVDPNIAIEDLIYGTDIPGLFVLPAGNSTGADTEYVASARTAQVLGRLTQHSPNRIVIFDSPPVLAASPASELASHVGQALMVVRADTTGEAALRDAVNILSGCADIKLLLNCTRFSPTGRRFGSYYGYQQ